MVPAEGHARDIELMFPEEAAHESNDAGDIRVLDEEKIAFGGGLDVSVTEFHDAWGVAEEGAGDGYGFLFVSGGDFDELGELGGVAEAGFGDTEAEVLCEGGSVDVIDHIVAGNFLEVSGEDGAGDEGGIEVTDFAAVGDAEEVGLFGDDVGEDFPEGFGELQVGTDLGDGLFVDAGHVDGIDDRAFDEVGADGAGDLDTDAFLGFLGGSAQVGGENGVIVLVVGIVFWGWLGFVHVEGGAGHGAGFETLAEGGFIDEAAAGAIDDADARLEKGDAFLVDDVLCFRGHRHVKRDEVGLFHGFIDLLDEFDTEEAGFASGQIGIVSDDPHAEGHGAAGEFTADAAHAEDGEGFVVEFHAFELFAFPFAGDDGGVGLGDVPGEGEHEAEGVFGGGDGIAGGRIHYDHPVLGGGGDIDVIDADAGAADGFEIGCSLENFGGYFRLAADDDAFIFFGDGEEFVFALAGDDVDVDIGIGLKFSDANFGDGIGDEDGVWIGHGRIGS